MLGFTVVHQRQLAAGRVSCHEALNVQHCLCDRVYVCVFVGAGFNSLSIVCLLMHVPDVYRGEGKRLMVSADVACSDMSRLINLKFIACFWPPTPFVTDAASFSKVAMRILQLIFKGVNNF